jgi:hypothetical protein
MAHIGNGSSLAMLIDDKQCLVTQVFLVVSGRD